MQKCTALNWSVAAKQVVDAEWSSHDERQKNAMAQTKSETNIEDEHAIENPLHKNVWTTTHWEYLVVYYTTR